jgi:hypothetical protein
MPRPGEIQTRRMPATVTGDPNNVRAAIDRVQTALRNLTAEVAVIREDVRQMRLELKGHEDIVNG